MFAMVEPLLIEVRWVLIETRGCVNGEWCWRTGSRA